MRLMEFWICDYDVPEKPHALRMRFYRRLWKILAEHHIETNRSTQSVWISQDKEVVESIHNLALQYGRSNLYEANRLQDVTAVTGGWVTGVTLQQ
jgi:hypothetical protein